MPRKIKGWVHQGHHTNSFDLYQDEKLLKGLYGSDAVKIISNSYMGSWYADIYLKEGSVQKRTIVSRFGSHMQFADKKGE